MTVIPPRLRHRTSDETLTGRPGSGCRPLLALQLAPRHLLATARSVTSASECCREAEHSPGRWGFEPEQQCPAVLQFLPYGCPQQTWLVSRTVARQTGLACTKHMGSRCNIGGGTDAEPRRKRRQKDAHDREIGSVSACEGTPKANQCGGAQTPPNSNFLDCRGQGAYRVRHRNQGCALKSMGVN